MQKNKKLQNLEVCNILGVNVNVTNIEDTVEILTNNVDSIRGDYVCVSNVHTTVMSYENKNYKNIQNYGLMVLPDGKPLSILSKVRGFKNAERVTGPDLMEEIFKISELHGYKHYFYGSTEETLNKLKNKLNEKYPNIKISGIYSPPFRELTKEEDMEVVKSINEISPDFVWVGLGAPKQEVWMYEHKNIINSVMIGVGAGFDYHAGNISRAPKWMQNMSLEWLYRLIQDPRRLWKRYLKTNLKFMILNAKRTKHYE